MQNSIALHTLIATSDDGFSFDEFILCLNEYAMTDGLPGIAMEVFTEQSYPCKSVFIRG